MSYGKNVPMSDLFSMTSHMPWKIVWDSPPWWSLRHCPNNCIILSQCLTVLMERGKPPTGENLLWNHTAIVFYGDNVTVSFSTSIRISFPVPIPHFPFLTFEPCFGSVFVFIADLDPDPAQNLNVFFRIHATGTCWCRLRMMDKKLLRF